MIGEENFKDVLKQRMKELADQTIRLCGLDPVVWRAQHENLQAVVAAQVPAASTHIDDGMDVDVGVMDLFDIFTQTTAETVMDEVATLEEKQEIATIQLFTFAELAAASPSKKRTKRPAKMLEDQLLLSFG